MKKVLPKSINNPKGFTLIELLVVISIIAILSIIGLVLYSGIQAKARNATRRADIDSIAKALELNKTSTGYISLATTQFANGVIPVLDPKAIVYCGNTTASTQPVDLTAATATDCTPTAGETGYSPISASIPPAGTSWKVCAWLEAEGATDAKAYCQASAQ